MLVLQTDDDLAGIANVETNESTTIEADNVGPPCCDGPAPAAKKLLAELFNNAGMPQEHELVIFS